MAKKFALNKLPNPTKNYKISQKIGSRAIMVNINETARSKFALSIKIDGVKKKPFLTEFETAAKARLAAQNYLIGYLDL